MENWKYLQSISIQQSAQTKSHTYVCTELCKMLDKIASISYLFDWGWKNKHLNNEMCEIYALDFYPR